MSHVSFFVALGYVLGIGTWLLGCGALFAQGVIGFVYEERSPLKNTILVGAALFGAAMFFAWLATEIS